MQKGDRVCIKAGYGYTAHVNGVEKFRRAEANKYGTVMNVLPGRQVSVLLDVSNGWAVVTGMNCVELCATDDK